MDHLAIMTPSWKLIPKILSGEKSIESRWYQTRRAPWNTASIGDRIFFKDSGKSMTARATVSRVWQFEIATARDAENIVKKFGARIAITNPDVSTWGKLPKYCVLLELQDSEPVEPFHINKSGFGSGAAWVSIDSIDRIRL